MLTPEDLKDVLSKLQEAGLDAILVGGQAVNLWAYRYSLDCPELQEWLPFSSEDLDFFGGRVEAMLCHEVLGGQVKLNRDFDPSPNAGVVLVNRSDRLLSQRSYNLVTACLTKSSETPPIDRSLLISPLNLASTPHERP